MTSEPNNLLLAYYGDDFTGSTDALEFLSRAGAKTVLFIQPPTQEQLQTYHGLQAIGVAGMTRAMSPDDMDKELRSAFTALRQLGAPHVHYKVCSTFDSSPTVGSIGKAIDIGMEIFNAPFVPLLVAAPALGRYCAFGNLFARMGIGSKGTIYRLDRHPSMSKHPVTPADEADLRLHLSKQTTKKMGLFDILQVELDEAKAKEELETTINRGAEVVLFDALYESQLAGIGKLIDSYSKDKPLFSVGSSGIEMALGSYWTQSGLLQTSQTWVDPGKAEPLLVVSGSCSPVTSGQIAWALAQGFAEVVLDTEALMTNDDSDDILKKYANEAIAFINDGRSIIVHTGCNKKDEKTETKKISGSGGDRVVIQTQTSQIFGTALGIIARTAAANTSLKRIVIAGGDTSSFAARAMGIEAVEMIAPLTPGAPLCKAYAPGSPVDGLEVNFKGGQVGSADYFGMVMEGKQLV